MLSDLSFSDLYVRLDRADKSRYRPADRVGTLPSNMVVSGEYDQEIQQLRKELVESGMVEGRFLYNGMVFRVAKQTMANGEVWVALRRVWTTLPTLEDLRVNTKLLDPLRALGARQGLILLSGATGAGKTTTAVALLGEYLRRYGQIASTIEDPVEYKMHGPHGAAGFCYQVEVEDDDQWAPALKTALRWHPRYIFVGEIRSPAAAKQLLRAATSGHLVITTIHAGSIEEALYAMIQSAHPELGALSHNLLADGLVAVTHQVLTPDGPRMSFATTRDQEEGLGDPIRACIRENRVGMVSTYIHQQAARLGLSGGSTFGPAKMTAAEREKKSGS